MGQNVDPSGQVDMQQLLAAAQQMQSQLFTAQQELADTEVEGSAGGGLVTVVVNGQGELVDVTIAAAAIDPAEPEESACSRRRWGRSPGWPATRARRGCPDSPGCPGLMSRRATTTTSSEPAVKGDGES